jgi:hypothetical protein
VAEARLMHARGIAVLALLVGGLVLAALLTEDDRPAGPDGVRVYDRAVFEGVTSDRIRLLRVESLARSSIVRLERDASGVWSLTDPIAYPADGGAVKALLDVVALLRAAPLPDADPASLGLDPPVAIVRVEERLGEEVRRTEVLVGRRDVDPSFAFYSVDGEVLRGPSSLFTAVDLNADEYRRQRVLGVPAREVIALERSGRFPLQEEPLEGGGWAAPDARLVAEETADGWRSVEPHKAALDLELVRQVLMATLLMRLEGFAADRPDAWAEFGLDEPALSLTVRTGSGGKQTLRFGHLPEEAEVEPERRRWYAAVDGLPHVWEVDYRGPWIAATAFETLVDTRVVRALRSDVTRLQIAAGEKEIRLVRPGSKWLLEQPDRSVPADPARVDDLLSILEQAQVAHTLPGVALPEGEVRGTYELETSDGRVQAGAIGPDHTTEDGAEGLVFLRGGDELCVLVGGRLADLLSADAAELRDRRAVELSGSDAVALRVRAPDGRTRAWTRDSRGLWCVESAPGIEDRELASIVDRLLSVRVKRWVQPPAEPLSDAYSVTLVPAVQSERVYRVARAGEGERIEIEGEIGELGPGLVEALERLFD